jgi:uncharacterized protein YcfJ
MRKKLTIYFLLFLCLLASDVLLAQSRSDCRREAERAERDQGGAIRGAGRGAVKGAVLGAVLGGKRGARRGAKIGAIGGGLRNRNNKRDAYDDAYERCLDGMDRD